MEKNRQKQIYMTNLLNLFDDDDDNEAPAPTPTLKPVKIKKQPVEDIRKARRKQTAEVFTPPLLVSQMLGKIPVEVWEPGKTFCDPSCGTGNFLIAVLWRKIELGHSPLDALKTIYGADIMQDNILECRERLLKIASVFEPVSEDHKKAVAKNIVWVDREIYPKGSLDYDFDFNDDDTLANR